jgi:hypothetical protein
MAPYLVWSRHKLLPALRRSQKADLPPVQVSEGPMFSSAAAVPATSPSPDMPGTVTIVVKNVYKNTSIQLALPLTEALSSVKNAISEQFDEHPAPDQQRLIFLGKVVSNDRLPLKDLLAQTKVGGSSLCENVFQ